VIAVLGVLAGADGPVAIAVWANIHAERLKQYLRLENGIPSHYTIARVLQALKPAAFQKCFAAWLTALCEASSTTETEEESDKFAQQIAIDGKCLRRSHKRCKNIGPLYLVNAWLTKHGIALGQVAAEEKSNEITAIPQLLQQLDLKKAVITIDAAGCQKNIADEIISGEGDYVLALKGNQENLHREVVQLFDNVLQEDTLPAAVSHYQETDKGHGRIEQRDYYQMAMPADSPEGQKWSGLKTIGLAIRRCTQKGKETIEMRYYISSLPCHGKHFAGYVRGHWSIENSLHWVLDMTFREDENRTQERQLANNLGWLRRLALSLLKQHPGSQSIAMKRRRAGWNFDFLMQVLTGKAT
jgi:predicted transposase YbfD/YdcC